MFEKDGVENYGDFKETGSFEFDDVLKKVVSPKTEIIQPKTIIKAADFWCGAGGTSSGLYLAMAELGYQLELTALNHWQIAYQTHKANHPDARHFCQSLEMTKPKWLFPTGNLDILVASPVCTYHSRARGGVPTTEQDRADFWDLQRWIEQLYIKNILIENVPEITGWGPLDEDGKPMKSHKGVFFQQFISFLEVLYTVEWKIVNCADYGDATTRERFFLMARRTKAAAQKFFPPTTHASPEVLAKEKAQLPSGSTRRKKWRTAYDIIDWSNHGVSVFLSKEEGRALNAKRPLVINTMRRIFNGLFKISLKPYLPEGYCCPTHSKLIGVKNGTGIPFMVNLKNKDRRMREIDRPIFTQTTGNHQCLIETFLLKCFGGNPNEIRGLADAPVFSLDQGQGIEPFYTNLSHTANNDGSMCYDTSKPLKTICGKGMMGVVEPFLAKFYGGADACRITKPIPTITANYEHFGLTESFVIGVGGSSGQKPAITVGQPLRTITGTPTFAFVEPFLVKFNNHQDAQSLSKPLATITTKDKFGLVEPSFYPENGETGVCFPDLGIVVFIRFRMLSIEELAAAMSFPKDYYFAGNRNEKVKLIGNAVPLMTAKKLTKSFFEQADGTNAD